MHRILSLCQPASLLGLACALFVAGCAGSIPNRDPVGEIFPSVSGESLSGEMIQLPADLRGEPAILLVGYLQESQFDIDRWLLGLMQLEVDARVLELPTIPSLGASLAADFIDNGMRSGIPREDWSVVVTLYGQAARPVAEFAGTTGGLPARVFVLDREGTVVEFHDTGYSAARVMSVVNRLESLQAESVAQAVAVDVP